MRTRKLKLGQSRSTEERKLPAPDSTTIKTKNRRPRLFVLEYTINNERTDHYATLRSMFLRKYNKDGWSVHGRYRTYEEAARVKKLQEVRHSFLSDIPLYIYRIVHI